MTTTVSSGPRRRAALPRVRFDGVPRRDRGRHRGTTAKHEERQTGEAGAARDHEGLRVPGRQRPHRPGHRARRDPCPARGERGGQEHAHERAVRAVRPGRRTDPRRRRARAVRRPGRRDGRGHRHGAPALHAGPGVHGRRERRAGARAREGRGSHRRAARAPPRPGDLGPVRVRGEPGRDGRGHPRRRAAARRDHQGPVARRARPHPRRADRGPHAAGDGRAHRDHARAQGGGDVDRLHHAQAARGARRRRPHHGHPPRQGRRHRRPERERDRARVPHGRPVRLPRGRQGARGGR